MDNNNNNQQQKQIWRSKLGYNYDKSFMEQNEKRLWKELQSVRTSIPENRFCADCGANGTVWSSVNLGVFLCMTCGAHHRALGTHISIPKGCTGTYWWSPDEINNMRTKGNAYAKRVYGDPKPPSTLSPHDTQGWIQFLTDKYVHKKYCSTTTTTTGATTKTDTTWTMTIARNSPIKPMKTKKNNESKSMSQHIDLIHFFDNDDPPFPQHPSSPTPNPSTTATATANTNTNNDSKQKNKGNRAISTTTTTTRTTTDFFADFGL